MRKLTSLTAVLMLSALCYTAKSQNLTSHLSAFEPSLKMQADSMKEVLQKQGFVVVKEAAMTMESDYELPVVLPLNRGNWYEFIFIGEPGFQKLELKMYEKNGKQVVFEKQYSGSSNLINYTYISKLSEYHIIKPIQFNSAKRKNIAGYILLMMKIK